MADAEKKEKTKKFFLRHIWDFVLLVALSLGTASVFIARSINEQRKEEDALVATVYKNNQKMEIKDEHGKSVNPFVLSTINDEKHYTIEGSKTDLVIAVKHNSICVYSSNCPGQECVHEGWVSHPNHPIICAYNEIFIEIVSHSWEEIIVG